MSIVKGCAASVWLAGVCGVRVDSENFVPTSEEESAADQRGAEILHALMTDVMTNGEELRGFLRRRFETPVAPPTEHPVRAGDADPVSTVPVVDDDPEAPTIQGVPVDRIRLDPTADYVHSGAVARQVVPVGDDTVMATGNDVRIEEMFASFEAYLNRVLAASQLEDKDAALAVCKSVESDLNSKYAGRWMLFKNVSIGQQLRVEIHKVYHALRLCRHRWGAAAVSEDGKIIIMFDEFKFDTMVLIKDIDGLISKNLPDGRQPIPDDFNVRSKL